MPYVPGAADEKPLVELLKKTFGANPKYSELACLGRLFWESHALALADLKQRQEHGSESVTKKLPTSERVARAKSRRSALVESSGGQIQNPLTNWWIDSFRWLRKML